MSKRALGRGIEALLQGNEQETTNLERDLMTVHIDRLVPNPDQPRKEFDEESLKELADSIRQQGIIQPIIVEPSGDDYMIVAGERRHRAAIAAGLRQVPVIIRPFTPEERLEIALIENVQREDLNPIEEAEAYHRLMEMASLAQAELAVKVGKNRSTVANALRLLKLPMEIKAALSDGRISPGHARAILSVVNPADQTHLFERIIDEELSVRETERRAAELNRGGRAAGGRTNTPVRSKDSDVNTIEQRLIDTLGTKVAVKGSPRKGRIEISYYSMDDLERLLELLGVDPESLS